MSKKSGRFENGSDDAFRMAAPRMKTEEGTVRAFVLNVGWRTKCDIEMLQWQARNPSCRLKFVSMPARGNEP